MGYASRAASQHGHDDTFGVLLVVAGTSALFSDGVAMVLVIVGSLLCIGGAVMVGRARRVLRSGGR